MLQAFDAFDGRTAISTEALPLRRRVLRGASFLIGRWTLASIIGIINVLLITTVIGPVNYGIYVTAVGIVGYLGAVSHLGIDVYLIRREEEPSIEAYNLAFTLLLISSISLMGAGYVLLPFLSMWVKTDGFVGPYLFLLVALPIGSLSIPALALLERKLDYRSVGAIELLAQVSYGVIGAALAFGGAGVWAPVIGHIASRVLRIALAWAASGLWPRLCWSRALVGDMMRYGIGYSSSMWIWQLRTLVNPLVVGGFLGPEAVALVGVANRITVALSMVRRAAGRLALVVMPKVQRDPSRSGRLMDEAMLLQTMALGPFLGGFALLGPWLLPFVYGPEWQGVFIVYPFVALGVLVNAVFNMHSSQLYVHKRNLDVSIFHIVYVALFAGAALVLVQWFGLIGYGYAEIVAMCSYWVIHLQVLKLLRPSYANAAPWLGAYIPPLFAPLVELPLVPLLWLPLAVVILLPRSRRQIREYAAQMFYRRRSS